MPIASARFPVEAVGKFVTIVGILGFIHREDSDRRLRPGTHEGVYPIREGAAAGVVVFIAIALGAYFVYARSLDQKFADTRRHLEEIAARIRQQDRTATAPSAPWHSRDAEGAGIARPYLYLRDTSLDLHRIYAFSASPEKVAVFFDTGPRIETKATPGAPSPEDTQIPQEGLRAAEQLRTRGIHDATCTSQRGYRFFVYTPFGSANGKVDAILGVENNWRLLKKQSSELRNALWIAIAIALAIGCLIGVVVTKLRRRALLTARDLSRAREIEKAMLGTLGEVIYERAAASGTTRWKGDLEALIGVSAEILGQRLDAWRDRIAAEDCAAFDESWQRAVEREAPFTLEYRVRQPAGDVRSVLDRSRPVRQHTGEFLYVGSLLDLTATRRAENMLRSFFQVAPTPLVVFDENSVTDANPAALRMFGCSTIEELNERGLESLMPPRQSDGRYSANAWRGEADQARTYGEAHFDWHFLKVTGEDLFVDVHLNWAEMHRRDALLMACHNMTAARRVQARLEESESRFRDVSAAVGEFIWEVNLRGMVTFASPRVKDILGLDSLEIVGKRLFDFVHSEDRGEIRRKLRGLIRRKAAFRDIECRALRADGQTLWVSASGIPVVNNTGRVTGFRGATSDISRRHHYEQTILLQKEAAEAAGRAKSAFLAVMSHEIRTPLNSVLGFTDLLLHTSLTHQQREYVETIRQSGDGLLLLLNDMLDFSKIESGKLDVDVRPTDIQRTVRDVIDMHKATAAAKGLHLAYAKNPDVPSHILTDPARLRQILLNLVGNAVKFTTVGSVTVLLEIERISGSVPTLRILVRDTGVGIPPEKIGRLFQPFSQVDSSTTRQFGGTGLGLVISKQLAELLSGSLGIAETSGNGTTFYLKIPATPVPEGRPAPLTVPDSGEQQPIRATLGSEKPSVLIVDDNAVNRRLAAKMVEQLGAHPECAASAGECLSLLENTKFDIILMDVQMPGTDGIEATRLIRAWELQTAKTRKSRIIALTADVMADDRERCFAAGMDDYLSKPIRRRELIDVFHRAAANKTSHMPG